VIFKLNWLVWKLEPIWPALTIVSLNFNILLVGFILWVALYYSIALIWFVYLIIFTFQTWWVQRLHRNYSKL
jgi:hypothetical protein